jgi:hypothetical protein
MNVRCNVSRRRREDGWAIPGRVYHTPIRKAALYDGFESQNHVLGFRFTFTLGKMVVYRPGDRVKDAAGKHFVIGFEEDAVAIEVARNAGFAIVDRAAYGAIDRAAQRLAILYLTLPHEAYDAAFELVLFTIGCEPIDLARAVMRARRR